MRYIAVDQYGNKIWIKQHPRKELSAQFPGRVGKMYRDVGASVVHVGYVIGQHWFDVLGLEGVTFATSEVIS